MSHEVLEGFGVRLELSLELLALRLLLLGEALLPGVLVRDERSEELANALLLSKSLLFFNTLG